MASISVLAMRNAESGSTDYDLAANAQNIAFDNEHSLKNVFDDHNDSNIDTEKGVHGLRYYNEQLEYWDIGLQEWLLVPIGNAGVNIGDVTGVSVTTSGSTAAIKWSDPEDIIVEGQTLAAWAGTKIVRKEGSAPLNVNDGILIVDNKIRNQYASSVYADSGLQANKVYYYRFFPYKMSGESTHIYTKGTSKPVSINKTVILNMPTVVGTYTYTGSKQTPTWNNYNENELTLSGDYEETDVGTYSAVFTPKSGYCWSDGTSSGKPVQWSIDKIKVAIPIVTNTSKIYNRSPQTPDIDCDLTKVIITGDNQTNVGNYNLVISLSDSSTSIWADDSTEDKRYPWSISAKTIPIPTLSGIYTYTGAPQQVTTSTIDSNEVIKDGDYIATDAGEHTVTFDLANPPDFINYTWTDGTTEQKTAKWTINKATGSVTLTYNGSLITPSTVLELSSASTARIVISQKKGGTVFASSSAINVAAVNVVNDELIITTGRIEAIADILITVNESDNYNSYNTTFKVSIPNGELFPWSTATDSQIQTMLNGYYGGTITLEEIKSVWSLGDVREVSLNAMSATGVSESHRAQTVEMRIIDFDHDYLVTPLNGKTKALITVDMKDCLMDAECAAGTKYGEDDAEKGYMNDTATNTTGWHASKRRTWCNNVCYNAFPTNFKNMIKQVKKSTASTGGTSSPAWWVSHDYCFILGEWETFGPDKYWQGGPPVSARSAETSEITSHIDKDANNASVNIEAGGTQYEYLKTRSNIGKKPQFTDISSRPYADQWLRSPYISNETDFVAVFIDGLSVDHSEASNTTYNHIAVACCL